MNNKEMSNQEMNAVVLLAQQGNEEAKTTVVKSVQNMVHKIVYLMNDGKFDEDLASIGYMGILKAIDSFDATRGTKFSTHAYWQIKGEISREFTNRSRDKRKINDATVLFSTPIFGHEDDEKTVEETLGGDVSEYAHIFEDGEGSIWWAYNQLNDSDKKLFFYKYIELQNRDQLKATMGLNTLSNLRRREILLKQRLNNLLGGKYDCPKAY